jgi:hypothetical protein
MHEQTNKFHGPEQTMNLISVEANVVETEATELQAQHVQEMIVELSSAQLMMVGGGGTILLD